ncbi:PALP domain-containing protein [Streptomyces griseus]|uniref:hypothetical protein n=1 Tax=Streptomyces griseus TaxID=1911 RepID=UPI0033F11BBA
MSSLHVGMRTYRSLTYEIAEQRARPLPGWITVPVSRGDAFCSVAAGFDEFGGSGRISRMLAVLRFPGLQESVRNSSELPLPSAYPDQMAALSVSVPRDGTAIRAVRHSGYTVAW